MQKYFQNADAADDGLFVKPVATHSVSETKAIDPFEEINKKNEALAAAKAKNAKYTKDPRQVPVDVIVTQTATKVALSPEQIVQELFTNK